MTEERPNTVAPGSESDEPSQQTDASLKTLLVEQAPDAMIFADRDGLIRVWNAAAEIMFGYSSADAVGRSLDIIVPDQFREAHWQGYDRALEAGETKYRGKSLPTRAMKANGETLYVELSFAIICDEGGAVIGALASARDITQRFEQDRTNRRRLRELEQELSTQM
ncbi:MAG: PAS domain S-box protein [Dehalococcoidia bacterium]|nr:PAS domain S-box protein [Dehalococcoidia bacterium]